MRLVAGKISRSMKETAFKPVTHEYLWRFRPVEEEVADSAKRMDRCKN